MIANAGYETGAAAAPGVASSWDSATTASLERTAEFAGDSALTIAGYETFEHGWGTVDPQEVKLSPATSSGTTENFEWGWFVDQGFMTLGGLEVAAFDTAPQAFEDFEQSWGTIDVDMVLSDGDVAHATTETFASGWGDTALTLGSVSTCSFNAGGLSTSSASPTNFETFILKLRQQVHSSITEDTLTAVTPPLDLVNGDAVTLETEAGTLPTPFTINTTYIVQERSGDSCKLAPFSAAWVIDITADGSGANYLVADPGRFWLDEL